MPRRASLTNHAFLGRFENDFFSCRHAGIKIPTVLESVKQSSSYDAHIAYIHDKKLSTKGVLFDILKWPDARANPRSCMNGLTFFSRA